MAELEGPLSPEQEDAAATGEDDPRADEVQIEKPPVPKEPEEEIEVPEGAEKPDAVKAAIQAERKKARDAYSKARDLEAQLKAREEESQPLEERVSAADRRAEEAELRALRLEVALETGISHKLAPRLTGSTREELVKDAEVFKAEVGTGQKPGMDGGYKESPPVSADPTKQHSIDIAALLGRTKQG